MTRVLAGLFALLVLAARAPAADFDPRLQAAFIEAMRLVEVRNYAAAIPILREVAARSGSARVKLELARALFYDRRYGEARALFNEVLLDGGTPWRVRDNIQGFLRRIDSIEGYIRYSVSVVHDSNPRNITSQREFTIGGFRLEFVPPEDNRAVTGLRYGVQAMKPLGPSAAFYFTGSYLDYPAISLDRLTFDTGVVKALRGGSAHGLAGVEAGTFGNKALYQFPYVGADYAFLASPTGRVVGGIKLGKVRFPDFPYLDAVYGSVTLSAQRPLPERALLSMRATAEHSEAYEHAYSYDGIAMGPGIFYLFTDPPVLVGANVLFGMRRYGGIDPLFGVRREDHRLAVELTVQHKELRWQGMTPTFIVSLEQNRSDIDFYAYRKANVAIAIQE